MWPNHDPEMLVLADRIIEHGFPVKFSVYHDGDGESGPWTSEYQGYRCGKAWVLLAPNGWVFVDTPNFHRTSELPYPHPLRDILRGVVPTTDTGGK